MIRAVTYARFSSDKQHDTSIEAQERACKEYAQAHGYNIVKSYVDQAITGKTANRASYQRMMRDMKKDKFDVILIHKYDRVARTIAEHINLQQKLNDNNAKLIAVAQDYGEGKEAKLMMGIQWILSEYYVDNLAEEVRKGMREVALKGQHNGGVPPFGYDVVNKKYQINFVEAEYVKRLYQCVLDGKGYTDLIDEMQEKGIKGKRGKLIGRSTVYEILRNKKYTGTYVYSLTEEKNRNDRRTKPNAIEVENALPVIIDKDTWEKVQIMLEKKKNQPHRAYKCSGKVYCKCGSKMHMSHTKKGNNEYYRYVCSKHCGAHTILADVVDRMVDMYLEELKSSKFKEELTNQLKKYSEDKLRLEIEFEEERKVRLAEKQKEIDNILGNLASGVLSQTVINICNDKLESLNAELEHIRTLKPFTNYTPESVGAWIDSILNASDDELPGIVIERIDVNDDEVTIISTLAKLIEKTHNASCGQELVAGKLNGTSHEKPHTGKCGDELVAGVGFGTPHTLADFISSIPAVYYGRKYKK